MRSYLFKPERAIKNIVELKKSKYLSFDGVNSKIVMIS
jgi:hypothetical protein